MTYDTQGRTPPTLVIWRDSVAAGDDSDAPHEWRLTIDPDATVADVVRTIADARYLASIRTGIATWIIDGDRPLAVVAQQWSEPRLLVKPDAPARAMVNPSGRPHLNARYWLQVDPMRVFEALRDGDPLPRR